MPKPQHKVKMAPYLVGRHLNSQANRAVAQVPTVVHCLLGGPGQLQVVRHLAVRHLPRPLPQLASKLLRYSLVQAGNTGVGDVSAACSGLAIRHSSVCGVWQQDISVTASREALHAGCWWLTTHSAALHRPGRAEKDTCRNVLSGSMLISAARVPKTKDSCPV